MIFFGKPDCDNLTRVGKNEYFKFLRAHSCQPEHYCKKSALVPKSAGGRVMASSIMTTGKLHLLATAAIFLLLLLPLSGFGQSLDPQDWESGLGDWTIENNVWEIGYPSNVGPSSPHGGDSCIGTVIDGDYPGSAISRLISPEFVVPNSDSIPRLRFWHYYHFAAYDYGKVEIRVVDGTPGAWTDLASTYYGHGGDEFMGWANDLKWTRPYFDLSAYSGQTVQISFYFYSISSGINPGWYIDDIEIETGALDFSNPEDWESGIDDWYCDFGSWEVGAPTNVGPDSAYNGNNCVATIIDGYYSDGRKSRLISPPLVVPSDNEYPRLRFWHWYHFASIDYGEVQIRTINNGVVSDWEALESAHFGYTDPNPTGWGSAGRWTQPYFDLSFYADDTIQIAFYFYSFKYGGQTNVGAGWYIDDIEIETGVMTFNNPEDWESGFDDWYCDFGNWEVGIPTNVGPESAHGGLNCVGTIIDADYSSRRQTRLISPPIEIPNSSQYPRLRFWHWYYIATNDIGKVQARVIDNGTPSDWVTLESAEFGGNTAYEAGWGSNGWTRPFFDLTGYADQTVQIAFYLGSSDDQVGAGWYIDDIEIETGAMTFNDPEDWESGFDDWYCDFGDWEVGTPSNVGPESAHSGINCVGTIIDYYYSSRRQSRLISPPVDIPDSSEYPRLRFWHYYHFANYDYGKVEIRVIDNGNPGSWEMLESGLFGDGGAPEFTGWNSSGKWTRPYYDIRAYSGQSVQFAFFIYSNNNDVNPGWYIDDIEIETGTIVFDDPEDWESGFDNWYCDFGSWEIGAPTSGPGSAYAGENCAATILDGNYSDRCKSRLISPPITVPSATYSPILKFKHWYDFNYIDYGEVQIRVIGDSIVDWQALPDGHFDYDGGTTGWEDSPEFDLTQYADSTVQLAFYQWTTKYNDVIHVDPGWYIDNISIQPGNGDGYLEYGDNITGSISTNGEIDTLYFYGNAGDVVNICMGCLYNLTCMLRLYDPTGALVDSVNDGYRSVEMSTVGLNSTGIYTILASDVGNNDADSYGLSLECVRPHESGTTITYGYCDTSSITPIADMDCYRFYADSGDVVSISMGCEYNLTCMLRLYDPAGALVDSVCDGYRSVEMSAISLNSAGTYTILTSDDGHNDADTYGLSLECVSPDETGMEIPYGYSGTTSIWPMSDMDSYRFYADSGDVVTISMGADNYLDCMLRLYDPAGTLIDSNHIGHSAEISACRLNSTGMFTVLTSDEGHEDTRTYGLSLECVSPDESGMEISYGYSGTTSIWPLSDMDSYRFYADSGDVVTIAMGAVNYLECVLRLYDPAGSLVDSNYTGTHNAELADVQLQLPGVYSILASENGHNDEYSYWLTLDAANPHIFILPSDTVSRGLCDVGEEICIDLPIINHETVTVAGGTWSDSILCFTPMSFGYHTVTVVAEGGEYKPDTADVVFYIYQDVPIVTDYRSVMFRTYDTSTVLPEAVPVNITTSCDPVTGSFRAKAFSSGDWLKINDTDLVFGSYPADIQISVDTLLPVGIYSGYIWLNSQQANTNPTIVTVTYYVESGVDIGHQYVTPNTNFMIPINLNTNDTLAAFTIPIKYYTTQPANVRLDSVWIDQDLADTAILIPDSQTIIVDRVIQEPPLPDSMFIIGYMYFTATADAFDEYIPIDTLTVTHESVEYTYQFTYWSDTANPVVPAFNSGLIGIGDEFEPVSMCGDADGNGSINLLDVVFIINYLYKGGPEPWPVGSMDCDGNALMNILDVTYLINYLYKGGPPPVCEGGLAKPYIETEFDGEIEVGYTDDGETIITVNSPVDIYGLDLTLELGGYGEVSVEPAGNIPNLYYSQTDDVIRLGVIDIMGRDFIPSGKTSVVKIDGEARVTSVIASDADANPVYFTIKESDSAPVLLPREFKLGQNYPNPFNPATTIRFDLPQAGRVELEVFNILGQKVSTLVDGQLEGGQYEVRWNGCNDGGENVASGVYFYRIAAGDFTASKKMVLLR